MQQTLVLLKPDCILRGLVGEVVSRFEKKGLKIKAMKMMNLSTDLLKDHYGHLASKPFFPEIVEYMQLSPVVALILEGPEAIVGMRNLCGATNPMESAMGTVRGDFALTIRYNIIHASDSEENAKAEIARFFKADEIFAYNKPASELL
nr:nucleoside-diphosphate kinase [Candidatus Gracilibacteria bacterium]